MRIMAWWLCGWVLLVVTQALLSRMALAHLAPNVIWVVVAFVALRQSLSTTLGVALPLGYVFGAATLAPSGLMEAAMVLVAIAVALASGNLVAQGLGYFTLACALGDVALCLTEASLLAWQRLEVGFSSWASAMLLPQAVLTALVGVVLYRPLCALERWLLPRHTEGLSWR